MGVNSGKKALNIRSWICQCGTEYDRDINAAININTAGLAEINAWGAPSTGETIGI